MSPTSTPQHPPPPPPPPPPPQDGNSLNFQMPSGTPARMNGETNASLTAAADLIRSLDAAFAEMTSMSSSAAKDAEDARRNARAASEVARRYTTRNFPKALPPSMSENTSRNYSPTFERKRKTNQSLPPGTPGSVAERLAQLHTDDVLTMSLDLERIKEELEQERREHDQTRMLSTLNRAKNCELESQMEKLLADMEKQREDHGRMVDRLKEELLRSKVRLEAAEEDAQVALDLAKDSASSRQELETLLERALEENTLLRDQLEQVGVPPGSVMPTSPLPSNKKNSVRFAESPTIVTVSNEDNAIVPSSHPPPTPPDVSMSSPSRAMVNAGRDLLSRTPEKAHVLRLTPQKSLERRKRLRERLKALGEDSASLVPSPAKSSEILSMNQTNESHRAVSNILRDSAVRLHLTGRWDHTAVENSSNLESLTRRFCTSVETKVKVQSVQISEQHVQINDLSSLCGYLENQLSASNGREVHNES